jgi:acetyl esterase
MPLDRSVSRLLAFLAAAQPNDGQPETSQDRRQSLSSLALTVERLPEPAGPDDLLQIPGPAGNLTVRIHAPANVRERRLPGLVFFHGGGWVAGGLDTHAGLCARLAEAGECLVLAVDYRLAPEHPFPAALLDGLAATRWVAANSAVLGVDPARIAVGGDSAGGGLAAAICQILRDDGAPSIALQLLICPILDLAFESDSRRTFVEGFFVSRETIERDFDAYCPAGVDRRDPRISPLYAASFAGLPPSVIHSAEFDPFRDEATTFAAALRQAGVPVREVRHPGMIHYFYAMAGAITYAHTAAEAIGGDIKAMLAKPRAQKRMSPAAIRSKAARSRRS